MAAPPPPSALTRQRSVSLSPKGADRRLVSAGAGISGGVMPDAPPPLMRDRSASESPPPYRPMSAAGMDTGPSFGFGRKGGKTKSKDTVKVFVRVRPPSAEEFKRGQDAVSYDADGAGLTLTLEDKVAHSFRFNKVFAPEMDQEAVFHFAGRPIVEGILNGFNGAVIAYGQTGSGKTHTMTGPMRGKGDFPSPDSPERGVIPRMLQELFFQLAMMPPRFEHEIRCSMIEIYKENVYDLLLPKKPKLEIKERMGAVITNAAEVPVLSVNDVLLVMNQGTQNRATAATKQNQHSSRSHSLFQVKVTVRDKKKKLTKMAELYMVDLAGSECASASFGLDTRPPKPGQRAIDPAERMKEGRLINQSLLALGGVISALTGKHKATHIPYRNSKLTLLLRNTFGGNSRTVLIVNASPSSLNGRQSLSSLRFGDRAASIRNRPKANAKLSAAELRRQLADANTMVLSQIMYLNKMEETLRAFRTTAMSMLASLPRGSRDFHRLLSSFPILQTCRKTIKPFKRVPHYLLAHIVTFTDGVTIARCSAVCKNWRAVVGTDRLWRLVIRLEFGEGKIKERPEDVSLQQFYSNIAAADYFAKQEALEAARKAARERLMGGGSGGAVAGIRLLPSAAKK